MLFLLLFLGLSFDEHRGCNCSCCDQLFHSERALELHVVSNIIFTGLQCLVGDKREYDRTGKEESVVILRCEAHLSILSMSVIWRKVAQSVAQ